MSRQFTLYSGEAHSKPHETSNMTFFVKIVNDFQLLTTLAKTSIADVWQGSEYASVHKNKQTKQGYDKSR